MAPDLYAALLAGAAAGGRPGASAKDVIVAATTRCCCRCPARRDERTAALRGEAPPAAPRSTSTTSPSSTPTPSSRAGRPRPALRCSSPPPVSAPSASSTTSLAALRPPVTPPQRVPRQGRDHLKGRTPWQPSSSTARRRTHVREGLVRVVTGSIEFSSRGDADMIRSPRRCARPCARAASATAPSPCSSPAPPARSRPSSSSPAWWRTCRTCSTSIAPAGAVLPAQRQPRRRQRPLARARRPRRAVADRARSSTAASRSGTYQDIVFCDFDARPRERSVVVQVMGV